MSSHSAACKWWREEYANPWGGICTALYEIRPSFGVCANCKRRTLNVDAKIEVSAVRNYVPRDLSPWSPLHRAIATVTLTKEAVNALENMFEQSLPDNGTNSRRHQYQLLRIANPLPEPLTRLALCRRSLKMTNDTRTTQLHPPMVALEYEAMAKRYAWPLDSSS